MIKMSKIIWFQFKYYWKSWIGELLLFVVAALLVGMCLTGIVSVAQANSEAFTGSRNPTPLFMFPAIFGLITLFMVASGAVKLVVTGLSRDYILWSVVGANSFQLCLIIGGQVALVGSIGALIGYIGAVPSTIYMYRWTQGIMGKSWLPDIHIGFSVLALVSTIFFISIVGGLAGFLHSRKLFVNSRKELLQFKKSSDNPYSPIRLIMLTVSAIGLFMSYRSALSVPSAVQDLISKGNHLEAMSEYVQSIIGIMFFGIIFFTLLAPILLIPTIKIWTRMLPRRHFITINLASWRTIFDRNYLTSLIAPLFGAEFLLTGMTYITSVIPGNGNKMQSTNEMLTLIFFLGAPLLIILSNVIVITLITSGQQSSNLNQLYLLGFTSKTIAIEEFWESIIFAVTFLIYSVVANFTMYWTLQKIILNTKSTRVLTLNSVFYWPSWIFVAIVLFISGINIYRLLYVKKNLVKSVS
jgi:hypothetical protein